MNLSLINNMLKIRETLAQKKYIDINIEGSALFSTTSM